MTAPQRPIPPTFPLLWLNNWAYGMSITVGAIGQILFLGAQFGGQGWSYVAAAAIAAYAEVTMAASGQWSLEHRRERRTWLPLLLLGLGVSKYAAVLNISHFWGDSPSMALMFGGASVVGFLLHVINGHIRVKAYLLADDKYRADADARETANRAAAEIEARTAEARAQEAQASAREAEARAAASTATGAGTDGRSRARKPSTRAQSRRGTRTDTTAVPAASTGPSEDASTGPSGSSTGLRLVSKTAPGTDPGAGAADVAAGTEWEPELWSRALTLATEYRAETGGDVRLDDVQERLGIGRNRAAVLRREVLAHLASVPAPTASVADGPVPDSQEVPEEAAR